MDTMKNEMNWEAFARAAAANVEAALMQVGGGPTAKRLLADAIVDLNKAIDALKEEANAV